MVDVSDGLEFLHTVAKGTHSSNLEFIDFVVVGEGSVTEVT